ncbi:MAG: hypothetical protein K6B45_01135 [Bacteroidaceae bacterium]|nr:hypothetical protein [Bacteroidaceae bacterium]
MESQSSTVNAFVKEGKRVAANKISKLNAGEIFVFGSNKGGAHGGGAAYFAFKQFGAVWGEGEGLFGQSYALPTMEGRKSMAEAVGRFIDFARQHTEYTFLVTAVGCGIAGYSPAEVAPLFAEAVNLPNVYLPESFWKYL